MSLATDHAIRALLFAADNLEELVNENPDEFVPDEGHIAHAAAKIERALMVINAQRASQIASMWRDRIIPATFAPSNREAVS